MDAASARQLLEAATNRAPASLGPRRTSSTHEFYRYPARFTPELARALIDALTSPGDVIADPFVGGGTSLVEGRLAGRITIGNDLNQLATFVAQVKSQVTSNETLDRVSAWAGNVPDELNLNARPASFDNWIRRGYLRNVDGPDLWRLRKYIAMARARAIAIRSPQAQGFVRCGLLRTAQWAIDMRDELPSVPEFRDALISNLNGMVEAARFYARAVRRVDRMVESSHARRTLIVTGRAQELSKNTTVRGYGAPRLVLTSPPYPGVYVNYHRWKLYGRRETPVPYWIAGRLDGQGLSYYTMGARAQKHLGSYFAELHAAFSSISSLCNKDTIIAQVVGFSEPDEQLPRYLAAMSAAGLREVTFKRCATEADGRLWREVPGRRWWARDNVNAEATASEVVLFHRLK